MTKKLIIVYEKDSEKAANYLRDFVTEKEKQKGEEREYQIESVLWSDKQFQDNQVTLSSKGAVVFLGKGKLIKKYTEHIETTDEYGMSYGYFGKTALLSVNKKVTNKEYQECMQKAQEYELKLKDVKLKKFNKVPVGAQVALGLFVPVVGITEISSNLTGMKSNSDSNTQRYKLLINIFYADILEHIMED